jgi:hypothetical protein
MLSRKIYFSYTDGMFPDGIQLKTTTGNRWSFYNTIYRVGEPNNLVNLRVDDVLVENWLFENVSYSKPCGESRSEYHSRIVGKALSKQAKVLFG